MRPWHLYNHGRGSFLACAMLSATTRATCSECTGGNCNVSALAQPSTATGTINAEPTGTVKVKPVCCVDPKPSEQACGRSGCHCCSDGRWMLGNSGPTLTSVRACGLKKLEPAKPCACCSQPRPSQPECGRSGCHCCSDGGWMFGNSGTTLTPARACGLKNLEPAKPCACCPQPRPSQLECGRVGCHCCSDGRWLPGKSGPILTSAQACKEEQLEPAKPCPVLLL